MSVSESDKLMTVVSLFNRQFNNSYRTCLTGGAQEPLYQPATSTDQLHKLSFRADYLSSALHEVAHWCIAGPQRLLQEDFGYWYSPDGRSTIEQRQFEKVEVKPQALEWMFSVACDHDFSISLDNLNCTDHEDNKAYQLFERAIVDQCLYWCENSQLPTRADCFIKGLTTVFAVNNPYETYHYKTFVKY